MPLSSYIPSSVTAFEQARAARRQEEEQKIRSLAAMAQIAQRQRALAQAAEMMPYEKALKEAQTEKALKAPKPTFQITETGTKEGKYQKMLLKDGVAVGPIGEPYDRPKGRERSPYFTPVYTPGGVKSFDNRTGRIVTTEGGMGVLKTADDPGTRGAVAGAQEEAKTGAKLTTTREFNMQGLNAALNTAESILKGEREVSPGIKANAPLPTGSLVGSAWDTAAGWIGMSPEGANEAQKLKAISGALVAKMPRMEGPQSDRDVLVYQQMAAEIGNDKIPRSRRLSALKETRRIWAKYEHLNRGGGTVAPESPAQQGWGIKRLD